jgi:hypothetical protein
MDVAGDGRVLLCGEELRSEISGIDPSTGKERWGLEWFDGSGLGDISPDGIAILFDEWGGPHGKEELATESGIERKGADRYTT